MKAWYWPAWRLANAAASKSTSAFETDLTVCDEVSKPLCLSRIADSPKSLTSTSARRFLGVFTSMDSASNSLVAKISMRLPILRFDKITASGPSKLRTLSMPSLTSSVTNRLMSIPSLQPLCECANRDLHPHLFLILSIFNRGLGSAVTRSRRCLNAQGHRPKRMETLPLFLYSLCTQLCSRCGSADASAYLYPLLWRYLIVGQHMESSMIGPH